MSALIEPSELNTILTGVKILDATYGVPNAQMLFAAGHIGNAQFFDIDAVADHASPYPHTLPAPEDFAKAVGALGIEADDAVVIYDQNGISFAASRAWWMFRVMGHKNVRILNGGLPAWQAAGLPLSSETTKPAPKQYIAHFRPDLYRSFDAMEDTKDLIVDARAPMRFNATVRGPDGDACPAHLPGSANANFTDLLDERGRLKPLADLKSVLGPYLDAPKITATCGSGVTACVLALGFHEVGVPDVAVYDGSWSEWSDRHQLR